MSWPKGPYYWQDGETLYCSIPFTWNLQGVYDRLALRDLFWNTAVVGGPAVELQPSFFDDLPNVTIAHASAGILQRINPQATRTSVGCPNRCGFCAVPTIEGCFRELSEWPDLPIICDNNLLRSSIAHLDKVFDRLEKHTGVDFNQGLDYRLVTDYHIERLSRLKSPTIRLACDSNKDIQPWLDTVERMIAGGVRKSWLSSYALIGWKDSPQDAWERCEAIAATVRLAYPMWFHELDASEANKVTQKQIDHGWTQTDMRAIMGYYYKHRGAVPVFTEAIR
jgi:hypothetical protein